MKGQAIINWEAIGAIGEIVGALGVIASLVYLGKQISINGRHVESSIYQSTNDTFVQWFGRIADNRELADIWYEKILQGQGATDLDNQGQALLSMFFLALENDYQHEKKGVVSRRTFEVPGTAALFNLPVVAHWLKIQAPLILTPEFIAVVDSLATRNQIERSRSQ